LAALGQLQAEASVAPLLAFLKTAESDEAVTEEFPKVFGMIGRPAIPHIERFLSDRSNPTFPVATAIEGLKEIAERHPNCRTECVNILARTLEQHADADGSINGFAVSALIDLAAVEVIDAMREAFRRNSVDISIAGDEEDVEIALGLRDYRSTPAPVYQIMPPGWFASSDASVSSGTIMRCRKRLCCLHADAGRCRDPDSRVQDQMAALLVPDQAAVAVEIGVAEA
jgi:hypothetical protein